MSTTNEIKLKLTIDNKEAVAALDLTEDNIKDLYTAFANVEKSQKKTSNELVDNLTAARNSIQGLKEAWSVISGVFSEPIRLFGEAEQAEMKLVQALKASNQFTQTKVDSLKDYAASLQAVTTFEDDAYISLMAQLQAMGLTTEQTKQAALQSANLASLMGVDLATAGRAMADLFNGNIGMLGRYIKGLDESIVKTGDLDAIMGMLNERLGGQAQAMAKTTSGELLQLNNLFGDLQEKAGGAVAFGISPLIAHLTDIANALNAMPNYVSGGVGAIGMLTAAFVLLRVTGVGKTVMELLKVGPSLASIGVIATATIPPITGVGTAFRAAAAGAKSFMASLGPMGWAMIGLSVILEAVMMLDLFSDSTDGATDKMGQLNDEFNKFDNSKLKGSIKEASVLIDENNQKLADAKREYQQLANTDYDTEEKRKQQLNVLAAIRAEINNRQNTSKLLQQELNDMQLVYNERNREALTLLTSQLTQIEKKLASSGSGAQNKELSALKDIYEQEKAIIKKGVDEGVKGAVEGSIMLANLEKDYNENRASILKTYANKRLDERTNALLQELDVEKSHTLKMLQLGGTAKNDQLGKEIDFLSKKMEILKNAGKPYAQVQNEIEEKKLEIILNGNNNKFEQAEKEIENDKKISDKKLSLAGAESDELLANDIVYLQNKIALYKENGKEIVDLELELSLKQLELSNVKTTKGKASDQYLDDLQNQLDAKENYFEEEARLLDKWKKDELKKYANDENAKTKINELYSKKRTEIDEEENKAKWDSAKQALTEIAGGFGKHTLMSKAASAAVATMNTYEAATKALTVDPILGPILAGIITVSGMMNVANILGTETPKAPGYAKGGIVVGENGPEVIEPMDSYAEGQSQMVNEVIKKMTNIAFFPTNDNGEMLKELKNMRSDLGVYSKRPVNANVNIGKKSAKEITVLGNNELTRTRL